MTNALPMTLRVYRKLSSAMLPLAPALIKRRLKQGKEDPARIGERRGMSADIRPHGPLVWIHGASVGEVLAAAALIERLRALNLRILLTSGTVTSAAIVAKRFPADIIHQYVPYDSPRYVGALSRSLAAFAGAVHRIRSVAQSDPVERGAADADGADQRPDVAALVSALEPDEPARSRRCSASSRSASPSRRSTRERFAALGSRNVVTTGNLKLDVPAPPADSAKLERLMSVTRGRPIIVAASTHPGEEEILLEAHRTLAGFFPSLLTVIVPRHPDRGEAIARTVAACGLHAALRSREELPTATTDIYVADTMGELGLFYRLAPIVFMGGSLVPHGGQNPIEAIKLGASIVHGPHVFNFTDVYEALDRAGGARQADTQEALVKQLGQLLADPGGARRVAGGLGSAWSNSSAARWSAR